MPYVNMPAKWFLLLLLVRHMLDFVVQGGEMASITVRVDDETKDQANRIAADFGFDLSSVTRAFYRQMIRENRIPLNLSYPEPSADSLESLAEAKEIFASGHSRFANPEELFEDLGI